MGSAKASAEREPRTLNVRHLGVVPYGDALALQLPDKILHAPDCAGLCPVCGIDLNEEPHTHDELAADPRWAALDELRGQL